MTSAKRSRVPDVRRLGAAVSFPGIDPRTWVSAARVDEDPEALSWDEDLGWVVDVSPYGSDLEGDSELPCRMATVGAVGDRYGEYCPPVVACEVLILFPAGDSETSPVLLGNLTNAEDCRAPTTVNGLPISGDAPSSSSVLVSPFDTEIVRSPHNRRHDYGGIWVLDSSDIRLGSDSGVQAALLGPPTNQNTSDFLTAVRVFATALEGFTSGPLVPLATLGTALRTSIQLIEPEIQNQLAQRVKVQ